MNVLQILVANITKSDVLEDCFLLSGKTYMNKYFVLNLRMGKTTTSRLKGKNKLDPFGRFACHLIDTTNNIILSINVDNNKVISPKNVPQELQRG